MKKRNIFWSCALLLFMAVSGISFCSCSDDGGEITTPTYEANAAKYQILDSKSPYSSVEFTETGKYIIEVRNGSAVSGVYDYGDNAVKPFFLNLMSGNSELNGATRSSVSSNFLFGNYTVDADGTYILEGFGKIKITTSGSSHSLAITPTSGASYTCAASLSNRITGNDNTDRLCRTWEIKSLEFIAIIDGKEFMNIKGDNTMDFVKQFLAGYGDNISDLEKEETLKSLLCPEYIIFTKSGSFVIKYDNGQMLSATWRWYNSEQTKVEFSRSNDFGIGMDLNRVQSVSYDGNILILTDSDSYSEAGENYELKIIYRLKVAN